MHKKRMYVHVCSGLMSRCETIAEAYYLSRKYKKELVIIWPKTVDCNIGFYDVFDEEQFGCIGHKVIEYRGWAGFIWAQIDEKKGFKYYIRKGKILFALSVFLKEISAFLMGDTALKIKLLVWVYNNKKTYIDFIPPSDVGWNGENYNVHIRNAWMETEKQLIKDSNIYIRAFCGIIKSIEEQKVDYKVLQFKQSYWEKVEHILNCNSSYIGIHIRRTDHCSAINVSGTQCFIDEINQLLVNESEIKFYLATDDIIEEQNLKKIFGSRIVTQEEKVWGRNTIEAMKSGIIDCLCLAKCKYVLGSYASVYSSFASRYGGVELKICELSDKIKE